MAARPAILNTAGSRSKHTEDIGQEILRLARAAEPSIIRPDWWMDRLLDWATRDPRRKVQLFRFIDVLPSLQNDEDIIEHLAEYLLRDSVPLPRTFRHVLRAAANGAWYSGTLANIVRTNAERMARRFIAGSAPSEAIETVEALRRRGMGFTLDVLGEATTSNGQADNYARQYRQLIIELNRVSSQWDMIERIDQGPAGPLPRVQVSLKLSSLSPDFDPIASAFSIEAVLERLRPILRCARESDAFVSIDMEQYKFKDLILAAARSVLTEPEFDDFADVGVVLQAYLVDTRDDLENVLGWASRRSAPMTVRLVKGAYWDYETVQAVQQGWPIPVLTNKWETDAAFESLTRRLFDHRDILRPAIASHNIRSLAAALACAEHLGASPREFEIQMLFGMGDPVKGAIVDMGYALRVYTPFGQFIPGMAYLIRRLLENTSNESFLRQCFSEHDSSEHLMANPAETRPASPPLPEPVCVDPQECGAMTPFAFEPLTDFSDEQPRRAMQDALDAVRPLFGHVYHPWIDGHPIDTERMVDSINPSDQHEIVGRVYWADTHNADQAVAAARRAFDEHWSTTPAPQRAGLLLKAVEIMRHRRFELAAWMVFETGKTWREADADVAEAMDFCKYYSQEMLRLAGRPRRRDFPGEQNRYLYRPRGVVAVIAPWNFPLAILAGMTTASLVAGNTVVMKPAEQSPVVAAQFMSVLQEAGTLPGVVNLLPGQGETVGAHLVEHPDVDVIAFTGSREVGLEINERAARSRANQRSPKRVIAEMGGKNAIIIDADADLDEAVLGVVSSSCGYSGQKCSACSRVIVHQAVREPFQDLLIEAIRSVPIGPAEKPETIIGPLIDAEARDKVMRYIEQGQRESQRVYARQLGEFADRGFYVPPNIFSHVAPGAVIAQEEIFGPVIAVIEAANFGHALQIANATRYALTGGVYSRTPNHIEQAKREYHVGNLYINRKITGALVDRQPFGGFRMSGMGSKAGGPDHLLQFMEPKTITENTLRHGFAPDTLSPAE